MFSIIGQFPRPFSSVLFRKFTNLEDFVRCPESHGWREMLGGGGVGGVLQKRQSPDFMSPELLTKSFYLNFTTFFQSFS